jgi:hypothetical protein
VRGDEGAAALDGDVAARELFFGGPGREAAVGGLLLLREETYDTP